MHFLQLSSIGVDNDEANRRVLREMLFTAPEVEQFISGVVSECVWWKASHCEAVNASFDIVLQCRSFLKRPCTREALMGSCLQRR